MIPSHSWRNQVEREHLNVLVNSDLFAEEVKLGKGQIT